MLHIFNFQIQAQGVKKRKQKQSYFFLINTYVEQNNPQKCAGDRDLTFKRYSTQKQLMPTYLW